MRMLELFSGSGVMAAAFSAEGFETTTIDIEPKYKPDYLMDLSATEFYDCPWDYQDYDVVWASPPCTKFSVAAIGKNWIDGKPRNEETKQAIELVKNTIQIINTANPHFWFIENPRGMLRKQECMAQFTRNTVTYCQYGHTVMKPTDIWTNACVQFKPPCSNGSPCHVRASRGSKTGVQGITGYAIRTRNDGRKFQTSLHPGDITRYGNNAYERAIIPKELCKFVAHWCAEELKK